MVNNIIFSVPLFRVIKIAEYSLNYEFFTFLRNRTGFRSMLDNVNSDLSSTFQCVFSILLVTRFAVWLSEMRSDYLNEDGIYTPSIEDLSYAHGQETRKRYLQELVAMHSYIKKADHFFNGQLIILICLLS